MLAFAGTALAQSPTGDAYSGVLGVQQNGGNSGGGNAPTASKSAPSAPSNVQHTTTAGNKSLPFTGFQLGLVALAGAGLLGSGFALRRASAAGGRAA